MWVTPIAKYDIPNTTFNDQENDLSGSIESWNCQDSAIYYMACTSLIGCHDKDSNF